jgi:predicted nucleic-acid-binding protein
VLAIDTNVVVRLLTADDPAQSRAARALVESEETFVSTTVLLETEWVLRSTYGFAPARIGQALTALAGLPRVTLENPPLVAKALTWLGEGMDFADALHLGSAQGCAAFVSFDRRLAKIANRVADLGVRLP